MKLKYLELASALVITAMLSVSATAKETEPSWWGRHHMGSMMGPGMMGGYGLCPMSMLDEVRATITETKDGVTITYSAKDKQDIDRIHKMAQIMKLSQELDGSDKRPTK